MKIGQKKTVDVEAKTLSIYMKVCDQFSGTIHDQDGKEIGGKEDCYVPDFMPGEHYGDYLILDIEIETGRITNWKPPTVEQIEKFIATEDDE